MTQHIRYGLTPLPFRDIAPLVRNVGYTGNVRRHSGINVQVRPPKADSSSVRTTIRSKRRSE